MHSRRILITGLSTYWGGRLARDAREGPAGRGDRRRRLRGPDARARAHGVRPGRRAALADPPGRAGRRDRHGRRHEAGRRLGDVSPRVAHERNVIGTMNILAACGGPDSPVRKFVFKSSAHYYGCEQDDPAFFTEEMRRPHPPRDADRARHRRGRGRRARLRGAQPSDDGHRAALRQRRGRGIRTSHIELFSGRRHPGHRRLRPALPVHPRGRHRRLPRARRASRRARRLQRGGRRRAGAVGGLRPARPADGAGHPAVGRGPRGDRAAPPGAEHPAGDAQADALRPRARQPPVQGRRLPLPVHDAGGGPAARASTCACGRSCDRPTRSTATRRRSRTSCGGARACA